MGVLHDCSPPPDDDLPQVVISQLTEDVAKWSLAFHEGSWARRRPGTARSSAPASLGRLPATSPSHSQSASRSAGRVRIRCANWSVRRDTAQSEALAGIPVAKTASSEQNAPSGHN